MAINDPLKPNPTPAAETAQPPRTAAEKITDSITPKSNQQEPQQPPPAETNAAAAMTPEGIANLVAAAITQRELEKQSDSQRQAAKTAFVGSPDHGLANVPPLYQGQLGNDPAKWPQEAAVIRKQFEDDWAKVQGSKPDIGGITRDGGTVTARVPVADHLTPEQRISASLPSANERRG